MALHAGVNSATLITSTCTSTTTGRDLECRKSLTTQYLHAVITIVWKCLHLVDVGIRQSFQEEECQRHVGNLDPSRGLFNTGELLTKLENAPNYEPFDSDDKIEDKIDDGRLLHHQHGMKQDPWAWRETLRQYRKKYSNTMYLQQYDITKFTKRRERRPYLIRKPLPRNGQRKIYGKID